MILLAADDFSNADIAEELGVKPHTVGRWRTRFNEHRLAGVEKDLPRAGRPCTSKDVESEIIRKTTKETPANATHSRYAGECRI
jgi:transposase-like protein